VPGLPIAAQLVAAVLGTGLLAADQAHASRHQAEAEELNAIAREVEARKMDQTTRALERKRAAAEEASGWAVKIAAAVTVADGDMDKLAVLLERQGMDKEAIGAFVGGLMRAGGAALGGLGKGVAATGRAATTGTQRLMQAAGGAQPAVQRAGGWLQSQGSAIAARGAQKAAPAAAAANPGVARAASKPLISPMTKAKVLGGGALLGAGYVGMKGLQAGRDYMMQPSGGYVGHGPPIMNNVGSAGYPVY
jgi:hypothetical protein